jgi:hypothetical protein
LPGSRPGRQLPKSMPRAKSGEATPGAAALIPVTSSGIEVTAARSTSPIHIRPRFVFSAMASPYRTSFVPAKAMTIRHRTNLTQTSTKAIILYESEVIKHKAPFSALLAGGVLYGIIK